MLTERSVFLYLDLGDITSPETDVTFSLFLTVLLSILWIVWVVFHRRK